MSIAYSQKNKRYLFFLYVHLELKNEEISFIFSYALFFNLYEDSPNSINEIPRSKIIVFISFPKVAP